MKPLIQDIAVWLVAFVAMAGESLIEWLLG